MRNAVFEEDLPPTARIELPCPIGELAPREPSQQIAVAPATERKIGEYRDAAPPG